MSYSTERLYFGRVTLRLSSSASSLLLAAAAAAGTAARRREVRGCEEEGGDERGRRAVEGLELLGRVHLQCSRTSVHALVFTHWCTCSLQAVHVQSTRVQ